MTTYTKAEQAIIWLCACTDLEARERIMLLRAAGSPEKLFERFEFFCEKILNREAEREGDLAARKRSLADFTDRAEQNGYFAVTAVSRDFPEPLKAAAPPLVLFGAGKRELLREKMFCVVGSRITPPWAEKFGMEIAGKLAKKFAVVTGLAEGGDLAAIRGSLLSGKLVCVLPCGLDECYPAAHAAVKEEIRRVGLLLSEYPFEEKTKKYSFHARNRILAGLAQGTLVLSAGEKSGALITANYALEFGRDVFAVPYNPVAAQGAGCNDLLKKGAYVCTDAQDIFDCYGFFPERERPPALEPKEEKIYRILHEEGELHTAVVAERAGLPAYEAAAILSALELKGFVTKAGGNRYTCLK